MTGTTRVSRFAATAIAGLVVVVLAGCRTAIEAPPARPAAGGWDVARAEILAWTADDPAFAQDRALEASGLAMAGRLLLATSEKYARLLVIDPAEGLRARTVPLDVPRHAELEGIAWHDGVVYLCDEAHAAVYRAEVGGEPELLAATGSVVVPAARVELAGVEVAGGKIGVEGIEISPDGRLAHLLLERSHLDAERCVSRIWALRVEPDRLVLDGERLEVRLEDCNWRLTGLAWMGERLLGLKTQYPGERYEIVEIDPGSGATTVLLDLTDLLRGVRAEGWGNNVEGIAIADDGALWLIGDNAVTGVIDETVPPPTDEKALLLRVPRAE
ncbi:MAG: esterase-like activity of phytase family protein [Thermoanaerobaculales bacterium]|jgi:hypothetical protein|nr:esterase-like activity of phytase family protein [Thermoanaerobaculales bacterium]